MNIHHMNENPPCRDRERNLDGCLQSHSTQGSIIGVTYAYRETLSNILERHRRKRYEQDHTDRLVSLYLTLMSAAVTRIASIASSSVTE